jgi:hypothetical protein
MAEERKDIKMCRIKVSISDILLSTEEHFGSGKNRAPTYEQNNRRKKPRSTVEAKKICTERIETMREEESKNTKGFG